MRFPTMPSTTTVEAARRLLDGTGSQADLDTMLAFQMGRFMRGEVDQAGAKAAVATYERWFREYCVPGASS